MNNQLTATAIAHSNIALIKYWGKLAKLGNYPAVPSLSLTLDAFSTSTQVTFDPQLTRDEFILDKSPNEGRPLERVTRLLDSIRSKSGLGLFARVVSTNNYPTASGLASSASGFAALTLAASRAAQLSMDPAALSCMARACSASAARSIFGGFTILPVGAECAMPFELDRAWDVALVVAVTDSAKKAIGSTVAMNQCSATSPCYPVWTAAAPLLFARACDALRQRDIDTLGQCMEESTWMMHATMLTAKPAVIYMAPATLSVINEIRNRRSSATPAYFTTDAGAHVKVLTLASHADAVRNWIDRLPGVSQVVICRPGPAAHLMGQTMKGVEP